MAKITTSLDELIRMRADARGFSLLPRQPVTSLLAGRHASRLRGRGLSFDRLREYQESDDVRDIDWKATARLRSPHVRVYSEERERPVLLLADQRRAMYFGSRRAMKSVVAAECAALAAWRTLESGDRIGGVIFSDTEITQIPARRSQSQVLRVLHEVRRQNGLLGKPMGTTPKVSLNDALETALHRAKHDHLIVLISDLDGADGRTRQLATELQAHNDVLVVAVYDPLGASLQSARGMAALSGGHYIQLMPGAQFSGNFTRQFEELLGHWRKIFRALRIPILPISTERPVPEQVRELLGTRF